ncbi:MAG: peptidoglycan D,D-transpeptidase FtsI family protein [Candidatus Limnocylindrus sp.]
MSADPRAVRTDRSGRGIVIGIALVLAGTLCLGRLAQWQLIERDRLLDVAGSRLSLSQSVEPLRGTIMDRTGSVVLAATVMRYQLIAETSELADTERSALESTLLQVLSLDDIDATRLRAGLAARRAWSLLLPALDESAAEAVRAASSAGRLPGVSLREVRTRLYPQPGGATETSLASHLLGFVNGSGAGQYGVEEYYNDQLGGSAQVTRLERGADGIERPVIVREAREGVDLQLSIDAGLQTLVEQEVAAAGVANQAESVSVVVMDPYSGDVLSSASWPSYDANRYGVVAARDPSRFIDPAVSSVYEPGSVMKAITSVAGLESGSYSPNSIIGDQSVLKLDNGVNEVRNADRRSKGQMTLAAAFAWSRNVVFSKIALSLGASTGEASRALYGTWLRFGFGGKTGIDVASESQGLVNSPEKQRWSELDLANASFGQGVGTTLIQLATAYSAMLNGGVLVRPRVVRAVDGVEQPIISRGKATTPRVSSQIVEMSTGLTKLVPIYTRLASIPNYASGGKSGTAQIWLNKELNGGEAGWDKRHYNFSYVGWIGRTSPEYVIAVSLRRVPPVVNRVGVILNNIESYELFRRVAEDLTVLFKMTPATPTSGRGLTSPAHRRAPEPSALVGLLVGGDPLRVERVTRRT